MIIGSCQPAALEPQQLPASTCTATVDNLSAHDAYAIQQRRSHVCGAGGLAEEEVQGVIKGGYQAAAPKPKHLLVLGWHDDIAELAASMELFAPEGSTVTVVSETKPPGWPAPPARGGEVVEGEEGEEAAQRVAPRKCSFRHQPGSPWTAKALVAANLAKAGVCCSKCIALQGGVVPTTGGGGEGEG